MSAGCPVRKLEPDGRSTGPGLRQVTDAEGSRWVVTSFDVGRQVLRDADGTRQAGFGGDGVRDQKMRPPILYQEGAQHRAQRKAAARFFAPKVTEGYRSMMEALSRDLLSGLRTDRRVDLTELSMRMAVQVAAQVVGLTNSSAKGMSRRLDTFFQGDPQTVVRTPAGLLQAALRATAVGRFYWLDVKPAIRARRRNPREDVISELIAQGFSDLEILTECMTYGAAGMVTTREFITMTAWHLLDEPDLLARYRAGDLEERTAILQETLRLEPVVGHLFRRTETPMTLSYGDQEVALAAESLVDLDLRAMNADPDTVGAFPHQLCPARELPPAVPPALMSFGDGHHRCPGGPLAIMETEIFLTTLLEREVVADGPPRVRWNPVSQGYDLNEFWIRLTA
jgi:cytochrome P450